jgi:uncharacterized protein (DUF1697 family)
MTFRSDEHKTMTTYVAFLRGINSGLNPTTKMDILKKAFERLGFRNVRTVIASGNVIFEAEAAKEPELEESIEEALPKAIGFASATIVYKLDGLKKLEKSNPFKGIKGTPETRPYVTFLKKPPKNKPKLDGKGFKIVGKSGRALFSVIDHSEGSSPDLMKVLDKEFGKTNTTRGWKTIEKILKKG